MSELLSIDADGYQILFDFKPHPRIDNVLIGRIRLITTADLEPPELSTREFMLEISDLQRLATYFEDHIEKLIAFRDVRDYVEPYWFMDYSLQYQLRPYLGIVDSNKEGSFTLEVMVKIGFVKHGVYCGIMTTVGTSSVYRFIENVRANYPR